MFIITAFVNLSVVILFQPALEMTEGRKSCCIFPLTCVCNALYTVKSLWKTEHKGIVSEANNKE